MIFVANPNVLTGGTGTKDDPWPVPRGLNGNLTPGVKPGDELLIMSGKIKGGTSCTLNGTPTSRITVRPYSDGMTTHQFTLDSYLSFSLPVSIDAAVEFIPLVSPDLQFVRAGDLLIMGINTPARECASIRSVVISGTTGVNVIRGWNGTTKRPHTSGSSAYVSTQAIDFSGASNVDWWGCDRVTEPWKQSTVMCSNPIRAFQAWPDSSGSNSWQRSGEGAYVPGANNIRFFYGLWHDNADSFFLTNGQGHEINGGITYNNGHIDPARGHGVGIYAQAIGTGIAIKRVQSFDNFSTGMKGFGETAQVENITFDEVISMNNGAPSAYPGNPANIGLNARSSAVEMTTGSTRPRNGAVRKSFLYNLESDTDIGGSTPTLWTNFVDGLELIDNDVIGGYQCVGFSENTDFKFSAMRIIGKTDVGNLVLCRVETQGVMDASLWDGNVYWDNGKLDSDGKRYTFAYIAGGSGANLPFTAPSGVPNWRSKTGKDANSTYNTGVPPDVIFRAVSCVPDIPSRSQVGIYNPKDLAVVPLTPALMTLLGFVPGDGYRIHNGLNYENDAQVVTGTYDGSPIPYAVDATTRQAVRAIGHNVTYQATTWPRAGFIVIYKTGVPVQNTIAVTPTNLSFTYQINGSQPAPQVLTISSTPKNQNFTIQSSQPWLTVTPATGDTNSAPHPSVSVNPTGFAAGTYSGTVTIVAPGATNTPQIVNVTLIVTAITPPVIVPVTDTTANNIRTLKWTLTSTGVVGAVPTTDLAGWQLKTVTVTGQFGAGGIVTIEETNDGTAYVVARDVNGTVVSTSSDKITTLLDNAKNIRPRVTAGVVSSVVVTITMSKVS